MHRWQGEEETENEKLLGEKTQELPPLRAFAESIEIHEKNMKTLSW